VSYFRIYIITPLHRYYHQSIQTCFRVKGCKGKNYVAGNASKLLDFKQKRFSATSIWWISILL